MAEERLQKLLSACGVASRRRAELLVQAGRITINGQTAVLGEKADLERDKILLDGVPIGPPQDRTYLMLNKPRGVVTTLSDEKGRKNVADLVYNCGARVWPVGRLDLDSEGLLLLTDDGAFTNHLTHPGHEIEKEYYVWVTGEINTALPALRSPMELDGMPLHLAQVELLEREGKHYRISITIHEGKNRQVRRMCALAGLQVNRLQRVREGHLHLGTLLPGCWRYLTVEEVRKFSSQLYS